MSELSEIQPENKNRKLLPLFIVIGVVAIAFLFISLSKDSHLFSRLLISKDVLFSRPTFETNNSFLTESSSDILDNLVFSYTAEKDGETPFSLLNENEEIEYDQYEFGTFVTSINGKASTNQFYWALYINDEYAQEASDKIVLKTGDKVEWKWEEVKAFE